MYRLVLESLLGLRLERDTLRLSPCIPAGWPGYRVRYRFRDTVSRIHVRQEAGQGAPPRLTVDGVANPGAAVPLFADPRHPPAGPLIPPAGSPRAPPLWCGTGRAGACPGP